MHFCAQCRETATREIPCTTRKLLSYGQGFDSPQLKFGPSHASQNINTRLSFTVDTSVVYEVSGGERASLFPLPTALARLFLCGFTISPCTE